MTLDAQVRLPSRDATALPTARHTRRRRRPSGAPPPLPRSIGTTGRGWLTLAIALLAWGVVAYNSPPVMRWTDRVDAAILRWIADLRAGWLTDVMHGISRAGSGWAPLVVALALLIALVVLRRWRHLFTFVGALALLEVVDSIVYVNVARPRPFDVTTIGRWKGFSLPAPTVATVAFVALSIAFTVVVAGRPRTIAKRVAAVVVVVFAASQLYLATYHPFDVALGVTLATAIAVNAFRFFTPNEVFPVSYRGGKTAHLDVGGRRGEAVRQAVRDQLGLEVVELKPVGLAGSGGSTPLRLRVAGEPDTYLFGKLYAMNHVRADRWYKLGRTILYGRLEDEAPFQTVRRLVEYEDYAARLLRDVGIPTAQPYGVVEMTPEREYLLVTEFFDDAKEIGDADVDDVVIDEGLQLIRRLWDNGLAHRDIKPANLLVQDGHLHLIDVFFVQVRPSPWRQAVDLANMMLVLALRSDAARVYERALEYFTPDEIAESFAAARGVASPTQLRVVMKRDGRDLLRQFRELAPPRQPISLQRWNVKRLTLTGAVIGCALLAVAALASVLVPAYDHELDAEPDCGTSNAMVLMAQAVPTATAVPCLAELPDGWEVGGMRVERGKGSFWLNSDRAGTRAVEATLLPADRCAPGSATEVRSDLAGARRFETAEPDAATPVFTRWYVFAGGCVRYRVDLGGPSAVSLRFEANDALGFEPRSTLVAHVRDRNGLRLCGAGAVCTGGA